LLRKVEFRGRKEVMDYLQRRFLQYSPKLSYKMNLHDVKLFGDALWYSYDYEIVSPKEHLIGRGMSMCRKDGAHWRIPEHAQFAARGRVRSVKQAMNRPAGRTVREQLSRMLQDRLFVQSG